ncbi:MAG: hypothetical protein H6819_06900 [Phycisphaerales bacterium]|nr:hypothetical protein [Phycisphaerales bacterium]MCB9855309.1 hypothetical protein [Phycisphaerales bacterium]MCB9862902.1 hypothetical protein [Phycisphaerales bacterium]
MFCGKELFPQVKTEVEDLQTIRATVARAASASRDQQFELARISVHKSLSSAGFPGIKRLVVPPGKQTVVCADGKQPVFLQAGNYSVTRSGAETGALGALLGGIRGGIVTVCEAPAAPFLANFVLPDGATLSEYDLMAQPAGEECFEIHESLDRVINNPSEVPSAQDAPGLMPFKSAIKAAYSSQNIRTSDDLLGGIEVQLRLKCDDPVQLQVNLINSHELFREHEELEDWDKFQKHERHSLMNRMFSALKMGFKLQEDVPPFTFRVSALFGRLRNEFEMAVRAAIRNETVQALYDTTDVRERVKGDIAHAMSHSLSLYGISIDQVVAFQFNCPEYEKLRFKRGQLVVDRSSLEDQKTKAAIDKERRDITTDNVRHATASDEQLKQHEISEGAKTAEIRDEAALDHQRRAQQRDAEQREHEREQLQSDERQRTMLDAEKVRSHQQLQYEKVKGLMELQNQQQDAALRRQTEWAKTVAQLNLDADSILAVMLQSNPQLGSVLVEMKRAAGMQQMLQMREQFEKRLVQVLGQDKQQIGRLMDEAVKQFGHVMAKRAEASRPQIISSSAGLLQISPTPPSNDENSPGNDNENLQGQKK